MDYIELDVSNLQRWFAGSHRRKRHERQQRGWIRSLLFRPPRQRRGSRASASTKLEPSDSTTSLTALRSCERLPEWCNGPRRRLRGRRRTSTYGGRPIDQRRHERHHDYHDTLGIHVCIGESRTYEPCWLRLQKNPNCAMPRPYSSRRRIYVYAAHTRSAGKSACLLPPRSETRGRPRRSIWAPPATAPLRTRLAV